MSCDGELPIPDLDSAIDAPADPIDMPEVTDQLDGDLGDGTVQTPYQYGNKWY